MALTHEDKVLTCRECGTQFLFSAGEQDFFEARGLTNEPGRCPACRLARKAQRASGAYANGRREMHEVECAQCGGVARVPFIPRNDKPVYCSSCFEHVRGDQGYAEADSQSYGS